MNYLSKLSMATEVKSQMGKVFEHLTHQEGFHFMTTFGSIMNLRTTQNKVADTRTPGVHGLP